MYQIQSLKKFKNIIHGFSTREDGNMSFLYSREQDVINNRLSFISKLDLDKDKCVGMFVVHGTKITIVEKKMLGKGITEYKAAIKTDGLITNKKGIYLFLLIADCLPIIIFEPKKEVIGLVHAGWKGLHKGVVKNTVDRFKKTYNCKPENLHVVIGPSIHKESYFFKDLKQKDDTRWKGFINKLADNKYTVDLIGFTLNQFLSQGVLEKNIIVDKNDTAKSNKFFSNYLSNQNNLKQGRFACLVGIRD